MFIKFSEFVNVFPFNLVLFRPAISFILKMYSLNIITIWFKLWNIKLKPITWYKRIEDCFYYQMYEDLYVVDSNQHGLNYITIKM